jgi:hypothetical protein
MTELNFSFRFTLSLDMSVIVVCTMQLANSFNDGQGHPQRCGVSTFESMVLSVCATYSEPCVLPTKRVCVFRVMLLDVLHHSTEICNADA